MNKKLNKGFKQKKRLALIRLVLLILLSVYLLFNGQFLMLIGLLLLLFVVNELFLADHNFYDPCDDYLYQFDAADRLKPNWLAGDTAFQCLNCDEAYDSAILAINVRHSWRGKFLDPFVIIRSGSIERRQYFERAVNGLRYLNISEFIHSSETISIETRYCNLSTKTAEVLLFSNPSLDKKKVLVIAPHADDAEIAAFGLYSTHDSAIVTVTAGELDAKAYESHLTNAEEASLLKGRLRSWDSVAVPQWAGLKSTDIIQLGYFCMQLKAMQNAPDEPVASKTAAVKDTRVFRGFNALALDSDKHGTPSWNTLIADLVECIERIKPDCIVMPHMELDPHQDHYYSSLAVKEALLQAAHKPAEIYLYANHLIYSDMFPFGSSHTLASLPPNMGKSLSAGSLVSIPLTLDQQRNKAMALAMMHDLQTPLRWKKRLRFQLQAWLIGRPLSPYGDDEYFRKAVRSNEIFFSYSTQQFLEADEDAIQA